MSEKKIERLYALANPDQFVNIAIVYNPLDTAERQVNKLVWGYERTLADYLDGLPDHIEWTVCVNGQIVDDDVRDKTRLYPDDWISIVPVPQGGGGSGKGVFRIVALIAVVILSVFTAGAAAAAYTAGMTAAQAAAAAGTASMVGALAGAAVSMVGGILVNALLPPPKPKTNSPDSSYKSGSESPSYGVTGAKNTATEDVPVPVVYGTFRVGGNITNIRTVNISNSQDLYMQMVVSEGPIEDISDVLVNDQLISNFQNVEFDKRLGLSDQPIMGWFDDSSKDVSSGTQLNTSWTGISTIGIADKVTAEFSFPQGLCATDSTTGDRRQASVAIEGQYKLHDAADTEWKSVKSSRAFKVVSGTNSVSPTVGLRVNVSAQTQPSSTEITYDRFGRAVTTEVYDAYGSYDMRVEYRKVGTGDWLVLGQRDGTVQNNYDYFGDGETYSYRYVAKTVTATFTVSDLEEAVYEIRMVQGSLSSFEVLDWTNPVFTDASRTTVRRTIEIGGLPSGRYDFRFRRSTETSTSDLLQDAIVLSHITEIITDDVKYNNTAFYGLKIRLTDQLNRVPKVTALVKGRKLDRYGLDGAFVDNVFTANPAWIALDVLTNEVYGGALSLSRITLPKFAEWAAECDRLGLQFNGVFDYNTNMWDALQSVCRVGRGQIINVGTKYSVVMEKTALPTMMFSVSNIIQDTFGIEWLPKKDRINDVEVTFYDKKNDYKRSSIKATDPATLTDGSPLRSGSFALIGVTDHTQAYREAWFQLALNKYILQTVTFDAPLEAIACTVGDLVYVQHDMPKWGDGGRLEEGSTPLVLVLDRPVFMSVGKSYRVLVHHSAVKRYDAQINSIIGKSVFLAGIPVSALKTVKRLKCNGRDVQVSGFYSGAYVEAVVEDVADFAPGMAVELWDTDVIEEQNVVLDLDGNGVTSITLSSPLEYEPSQFANFMFGENAKMKKLFRILSVTGNGDYTRTIKALEYNESVYLDPEHAIPTPNYSALEGIKHVTNLTAYEEMYSSGGVIGTRLILNWDIPTGGVYDGADVYVSRNDIQSHVYKAAGGTSTFAFDVNDNEKITVKVVAFDGVGARATGEAPSLTTFITGQTAPPSKVMGLTAKKVIAGIELSWNKNPEADVVGYEIRNGVSWDGGEVVVTAYAGTRMSISRGQSDVLHIKAIDARGNYSEYAETLVLDLPKPATVEDFLALQNGAFISFHWLLNQEPDIAFYEIREGDIWGASSLVARVTSNSYSMPISTFSDRNFMIKAVDTAKFYSEVAAFSTTKIAPMDDKNKVWSRNEGALSWSGSKSHMSATASGLVLDEGIDHGEYVVPMDLPSQYYARITADMFFDAVAGLSKSWSDSKFVWNALAAKKSWEPGAGNAANVSSAIEISGYVGSTPGYVEEFGFENTLVGVNGTVASESVGTSYENGRFRKGLLISDVTTVSWNKAIPEQFALHFWVKIKKESDANLIRLSTNDDRNLSVFCSFSGETYSLNGSDGEIVLSGLKPQIGDILFVGITQTATDRGFFIGRMSDGYKTSGVAALPPIAPWSSVRMY